jgi:hypothetical protein
MASGRELAERALREPMRAVGWQPQAAGWFTRQIAAGSLGVHALGVASRYSRPQTARIMLHVGLRDETTERLASQLCALKDGGYRQRTAVTGIGYLLPGSTWRDWQITPGNAGEIASQLARAVQHYAEPYLRRLASDPGALLEAARNSAGYAQAVGKCRVVILLANSRGRDQAMAFLRELTDELRTRTDAAAEREREMAARARDWLTAD